MTPLWSKGSKKRDVVESAKKRMSDLKDQTVELLKSKAWITVSFYRLGIFAKVYRSGRLARLIVSVLRRNWRFRLLLGHSERQITERRWSYCKRLP